MHWEPHAGTAILRATPQVLHTLVRELPAELLHATEGPGTWSPYDIVGHLVHGEETDWIPRARIILGDAPERRFVPFDRHAQQGADRRVPVSERLDELGRLRSENLRTLEGWNLTETQLGRTGIHPEFGEVTLRQLLATWVAHDLGHIAQVARVLAKQYREAVGPWRAYLSIMDR